MKRQLECEGGAYPYAIQVHVRIADSMCALPVLRKTGLNAVFYTKLVLLLRRVFPARVEEGVIFYLKTRLRLVVRPCRCYA